MHDPEIQVAGRGFASYKIPAWIFLPRMLGALLTGAALICASLWIFGWDWIGGGFTNTVAAVAGCVVVLAILAVWGILHSAFLSKLLNLRIENSKTVYGGGAGVRGALVAAALVTLPLAVCLSVGARSAATFPVPSALKQVFIQTPVPGSALNKALRPVFLWDYATAYNPAWFDGIEIVLPYEKGPPQKLLGSFYFQNRKTRALVASFYGKRPRQYDVNQIQSLFANPLPPLRQWPLLYALAKEAGGSDTRELDLFANQITQDGAVFNTRSIGTPGKIFLLGPDGGVFQVRCTQPCMVPEMLGMARFPADPRANLKERQALTQRKLQALLEIYPKTPLERARHNTELTLALISWLTLDPRDPEAFFHIGKLATNRETLMSAIRYGKDLGMNPAELAELESGLSKFGY